MTYGIVEFRFVVLIDVCNDLSHVRSHLMQLIVQVFSNVKTRKT
jgi:hypothetical protein